MFMIINQMCLTEFATSVYSYETIFTIALNFRLQSRERFEEARLASQIVGRTSGWRVFLMSIYSQFTFSPL